MLSFSDDSREALFSDISDTAAEGSVPLISYCSALLSLVDETLKELSSDITDTADEESSAGLVFELSLLQAAAERIINAKKLLKYVVLY